MKKLILLMSIGIIGLLSCKKHSESCCVIISTSAYIRFEKDGKNYITKDNEAKLKLFVVENNKEIELFNQGPGIGIGFNIVKGSDDTSVFLLYGDNGKSSQSEIKTYIIDFGDGTRDTLALTLKTNGNSLICTSITHDGKVVWNATSNVKIAGMPWERSIVINKN